MQRNGGRAIGSTSDVAKGGARTVEDASARKSRASFRGRLVVLRRGKYGAAVRFTADPTDELTAAAVGRQFVLRADFELLDEDGCSWISLRFLRGPRPPRPGELVYLLDFGGRGCTGTVERVEGWYACVRPDWTTWTGGDLPLGARDLAG
jgi:hypothetical protein